MRFLIALRLRIDSLHICYIVNHASDSLLAPRRSLYSQRGLHTYVNQTTDPQQTVRHCYGDAEASTRVHVYTHISNHRRDSTNNVYCTHTSRPQLRDMYRRRVTTPGTQQTQTPLQPPSVPHLPKILLTQPCETRSCRLMSHGRTPL